MGVLPGAEPFAAGGGEVGVVLSHGRTGASTSDPEQFARARACAPAAG